MFAKFENGKLVSSECPSGLELPAGWRIETKVNWETDWVAGDKSDLTVNWHSWEYGDQSYVDAEEWLGVIRGSAHPGAKPCTACDVERRKGWARFTALNKSPTCGKCFLLKTNDERLHDRRHLARREEEQRKAAKQLKGQELLRLARKQGATAALKAEESKRQAKLQSEYKRGKGRNKLR